MATNLDEVKTAFKDAKIKMVAKGAGIEIEPRLEMIRYIFQASTSTSVHMKDTDFGPEGFLPFMDGILKGFGPC